MDADHLNAGPYGQGRSIHTFVCRTSRYPALAFNRRLSVVEEAISRVLDRSTYKRAWYSFNSHSKASPTKELHHQLSALPVVNPVSHHFTFLKQTRRLPCANMDSYIMNTYPQATLDLPTQPFSVSQASSSLTGHFIEVPSVSHDVS